MLPQPLSRATLAGLLMLAFLVVVSWQGVIDDLSVAYLNDALVQASLAFALARAINAIISVLQSTSISVVFLSIAPGELLSPINDLVEQFSTLMKYAIGSLLLQKFLLQIVSDTIFKVLVAGLGLALGVCVVWRRTTAFRYLYRPFLFVIFLRFLIVLSVLANGVADRVFLAAEAEQNLAALEVYPARIESMHTDEVLTPAARQTLQQDLERLQLAMQERRAALEQATVQREVQRAEIARLEAEREQRHAQIGVLQRFNPLREDAELDSLNQALAEARAARARHEQGIEQAEAELARYRAEQEVIASTLAGTSGGVLQAMVDSARKLGGSIVSGGLVSAFNDMMDRLVNVVSEVVPIVMNLIALFVLQTMVLPLLFLYAVLKGFKAIWGQDPQAWVRQLGARATPAYPPA